MFYYYLNLKQQEYCGYNYEIHKISCSYCNVTSNNFIYIGLYSNDYDALLAAKTRYREKALWIDGCKHCCPSIHNE